MPRTPNQVAENRADQPPEAQMASTEIIEQTQVLLAQLKDRLALEQNLDAKQAA